MSGRADATVSGLSLDANGPGVITQTDSAGSRIVGNTIVNTTQFSGVQLGANGHLVENNLFNNGNGNGVLVSGSHKHDPDEQDERRGRWWHQRRPISEQPRPVREQPADRQPDHR